MLKDVLGMSERLLCKPVGLARPTYRRNPWQEIHKFDLQDLTDT
jgi:hypothetical protein